MVTVKQRIDELLALHGGSFRQVAVVIEVDYSYLHRLYTGSKRYPSETVLRKLGLKYVETFYEKL